MAPSTLPSHSPLKVLIPIHPGMDTIDLTGPCEIFNYASQDSTPLFSTTICASDLITYTEQRVGIARDITFEEAHLRLKEWDIVMVPGGRVPQHIGACNGNPEVVGLLRKFGELADKEKCGSCGHGQANLRTVFSICTGSLFLACAGLLTNRTATTHWGSIDLLRKGKYGDVGEVVEERFVVNQRSKSGNKALAVITSGGVSCGMDAALWLVEVVGDEGSRGDVERMLEYKGRSGEGLFV